MRKKIGEIRAVDGVSFIIRKGETFGLVGESGCGKTTVARCVAGLYTPTEGEIIFEGISLTNASSEEMRYIRRKIALVFQDPYSSLDPRQRVVSIVGEPLIVHRLVKDKKEWKETVTNLLRSVGLDPEMANRYPHEFSGGQRQRIALARALAGNPSLIICDEPLSALDVSIQAQIINLLKELQEARRGLSYLFISHDLSVVRYVCDTVAVMYLGRIVEMANSEELFENPLHPYTKALLSAVPIPDPFIEEKRNVLLLRGEPPSPVAPPMGCSFNTRCPEASFECRYVSPTLIPVNRNHYVACKKYERDTVGIRS
ncbi:MAG: oligopeptide/dipeptide ABC transporter ATP-binding protein [candidate division WOR-3 bacterium]